MTHYAFQVNATDGQARACTITTPRGLIETPIFMPVGTQGSVKGVAPDDLLAIGAQIILANTYHLMLRPGKKFFQDFGGLHRFMSWSKPILTDSGGFQVFSLMQGVPRGRSKATGLSKSLVKISDEGVVFRSYLDGSIHPMSPEESMYIQMAIGSNFLMPLDQCPEGTADRASIQKAMDRTTAWLKRSIAVMNREDARLFGIVQGGIHSDLRKAHVQAITEHQLFGYALGGFSVGEKKEDMWLALAETTKVMPMEHPRYIMGVGTPDDILLGIRLGVDMFDCVMPTRNARNGTLFTHYGKLSIKNERFKEDKNPIDPICPCYTCRTFSRAYLRHLFLSHEVLFYRLASLHNLAYYLTLVSDARMAIMERRYEAFFQERTAQHKML